MKFGDWKRVLGLCAVLAAFAGGCQTVEEVYSLVHPEQRRIYYRDPTSLPTADLPTTEAPRTVTNPTSADAKRFMSLDECIHVALENSNVIRVLAGLSVGSSGQTIYDPAIVNTTIDEARARFDPILGANNTFSQDETPNGIFNPVPPQVRIAGTKSELYNLDTSLSQTNPLGGISQLRVGALRSFVEPGLFPLNPQISYGTEMSYTQPLLRGGGLRANLAPVLIARLDTERSFFQFKDSLQNLVSSTVEAYWLLVFARTDRWAREQQVEQAEFAYELESGRYRNELKNNADVAQARVALANFRATLVAAKSSVLQREAALLGIMGLSPTEGGEVVPTTPPRRDRMEFQWDELVSLGERYRPDLVELKLIIEADQQQINIARNNALPNLDAVALYRWDGLRGIAPNGDTLGTSGNQFTDWTLGVNFSVPLGLRAGRAAERQRELVLVRDRANLQQGLLNAVNSLAISVRDLDQYYEQFDAYSETRDAALFNLQKQSSEVTNGRTILLNLLQAITDWGNAVSSQAQALSLYNSELAQLEQQTGTILEAHGVRFMEERFKFAGPCCLADRCYPAGIMPTSNADRYPKSNQPSEEAFDLKNPVQRGTKSTSDRPGVPPPPSKPDFEVTVPALPPDPQPE